MGSKPVWAFAGIFMAAFGLTGCESSQSYCANRSYASPTNGYAQASPTYFSQPRASTVSAYSGLRSNAESSSPTIEVSCSPQTLSGISPTSGGPSPTMTITIPSIKLVVPVNGSFTYGAAAGVTPASNTASDASSALRSSVNVSSLSVENSVPRLSTPAAGASAPYAPSTPSTNSGPYSLSIPAYNPPAISAPLAAPALTPAPGYRSSTNPMAVPGNSYGGMAGSSAPLTVSEDDPRSGRSPSMNPPPPPVWPRSPSSFDDGTANDPSAPPPLPIRRSPALYSNSPSPYGNPPPQGYGPPPTAQQVPGYYQP